MKRLAWHWGKLEHMCPSREGRAATDSPVGHAALHTCRGHQSQNVQPEWCIQVLCSVHSEHLSMAALTGALWPSSGELWPHGKV